MTNPTSLEVDDKTVLHVPAQTSRPDEASKRELADPTNPLAAGECCSAAKMIGRFYILEEIARGGMGAILSVQDSSLKRKVAVKLLLGEHADKIELKRRFVEEALIMGDLQHPGVVPIFEVGELDDGRPYFAMKLVEGDSLADLLNRRSGPQEDLPRFLRILERVCQTIACAHTRRVIHRDLKPLNVMVGVHGEVLVMDWGLSKRLSPLKSIDALAAKRFPATSDDETPTETDASGDRTRTGSVLGTPAYLPPEQAQGHADTCDERGDVFGLGAILCEILTGKPPYWDADQQVVLAEAMNADLGPAHERLTRCGANRELVALASRCLSPNRDDRPANASAVADVLAKYLDSSLRIAESDLSRFFELSLDLFCIATLDGFFRRVNANFSRVLGYAESELLAHPFVDFVHADDVESTLAAVAKLALGIPVVAFHNRYRDVSGQYRWFEWTAKAVPEDGLIFAVARDVTSLIDDGGGASNLPQTRVKPR